ncbi:MAG: polymer-forming cytoskeletal protein [Caldilineaceae bacterium]
MLKQAKRRINWWLVVGLVLLLVFGLAGTALAVAVRGGDTVTIGKTEVIDDDLVVSGNTVVVDGVIKGDLVAAGQKVVINGKVAGSLIMAGQTLELNGQVGGTVYSAGAALSVGQTATVARNLFFAGYSYTAAKGSVIQRDNLLAGYQAILHGEVKRNLLAGLGALELNGAIGGDVNASVAEPSTGGQPQFWGPGFGANLPPSINPGLRVGPEAKIGGKLMYTSAVEQSGAINAKPEKGVAYSTPQPATTSATATPATPRNPTLEWIWARLREIVTLWLIGALALWLMPMIFNRVAERTEVQPWLDAAWGLLVGFVGYGGALLAIFLLILVVAGLAALTLAGLAMSVFGFGFSMLSLTFTVFLLLGAYASKLVVVYPLTHHLFERFAPSLNEYRIVPLFVGVLVFVLLRSIPYLGVLVEIGVTLVGLGAMWLTFRDRFTKAPAPKLILAPA